MWTHELGHAVAAWLSGLFAIPLPFVTVWPSEDRSVLVMLVVALVWGAMIVWGLRHRAPAMVAAGVVVCGLQVWLTFVAPLGRALQWVIWAGMGGEILLSAVVVAAFYQRLPYRWDFLRFPIAATAAVSLVHALHLWTVVAFFDASRMPRGSAVGDSSEGDLEKLIRTHEFTERSLAVTNLSIAVACCVALIALYGIHVVRARRP